MKFGLRIPSLRRRLAARLSWRRFVRHNLGLKAPRGLGWLTNPRRALYNRIYNRVTIGCGVVLAFAVGTTLLFLFLLLTPGRHAVKGDQRSTGLQRVATRLQG